MGHFSRRVRIITLCLQQEWLAGPAKSPHGYSLCSKLLMLMILLIPRFQLSSNLLCMWKSRNAAHARTASAAEPYALCLPACRGFHRPGGGSAGAASSFSASRRPTKPSWLGSTEREVRAGVRVVCVWTCRCWELLWGFGVRTRQQVKIEANLCLSGPDIYSNTLVFLRKKIRKNKLTTRTSNTTSYEHLWETYEVGRSSVMIKITTDTLLSVTDLGFRCRGAEHLLLLLDTRKTSFIAKKF
jgi:hypothetical protein